MLALMTRKAQSYPKPYSPEESARVRAWLREQLAARDWTQSELAMRLGLTSGGVSSFLNGKTGMGSALVRGMCRVFNVTEAELLGGKAPSPTGPLPLESRPGWDAAVKEAMAFEHFRILPPFAFFAVGETLWQAPLRLDGQTVGGLAFLWWKNASDEERAEVYARFAERTMKARDERIAKSLLNASESGDPATTEEPADGSGQHRFVPRTATKK